MKDRTTRLRELAGRGELAERLKTADAQERRELTGAAFEVAFPVVFQHLTRKLEQRRGHWRCASAVSRLADECLDGFYADTEAVVDRMLTKLASPVSNLEGWIVPNLVPATVDAHRRRRGERGAPQRPRLPQWLVRSLPSDPWPRTLALEILNWVGVTETAGLSIWPLESWAVRRATVTGDWVGSDVRVVGDEVEAVLAAMRRKPAWFEKYIERPLGAKAAPVALGSAEGVESHLALVDPHEQEHAQRLDLAAVALSLIEDRLAAGVDPAHAVGEALTGVFGALDGAADMADAPHAATGVDEQISALVADPAQLARITAAVLEILGVTPGLRPGPVLLGRAA